MFVEGKDLVYFGLPKCASEFMRLALGTKWNNEHHNYDWDASSISYCHVRPRRFVDHHGLPPTVDMFTLVRNPYDRVVSTWAYGVQRGIDYSVEGEDFPGFVERLYAMRDKPRNETPLSWMHMSVHEYFGDDLVDKVKIFKLENFQECLDWLASKHGVVVRNKGKINSTVRDHYSAYYDDATRRMVTEMYAKDIERFGYVFAPAFSQTKAVEITTSGLGSPAYSGPVVQEALSVS